MDWDYSYIFKLLDFKTTNTANCIERIGRYEGTVLKYDKSEIDYKVARIRLANKLIKRIREDYYSFECFDYEISTFDFIPTVEVDENGDNYYQMHSEVIVDRLDDYFKKYPLVYKQVVSKLEGEPSRMRIAINMGKVNHDRARRIVFDILNNHIETWWM